MGASVGAAARTAGARVLWCSDSRSVLTRDRAEAAQLVERRSLEALCEESDFVLSVCPPAHAAALAAEVAATGFVGVFVDANAVAPDTVRALAAQFEPGRVQFVDGGLIGPPAWRQGTTRLHLSGEGAKRVTALFAGSFLEARVVEGGIGAASALKMVFAAQSKGHSALLLATLAVASAHGVESALLAEWDKTQPSLVRRVRGSAPMLAAKAWRFEGEMLEIAETFRAAGLPEAFHRAAAELYGRLADFKEAEAPELAAVLARLREASS